MGFRGFWMCLCCVGIFAACEDTPQQGQQVSATEIEDLNGIEDLVSIFDQDKGVVRMVMLVSPT